MQNTSHTSQITIFGAILKKERNVKIGNCLALKVQPHRAAHDDVVVRVEVLRVAVVVQAAEQQHLVDDVVEADLRPETPIMNERWVKLLYTGFETCFGWDTGT